MKIVDNNLFRIEHETWLSDYTAHEILNNVFYKFVNEQENYSLLCIRRHSYSYTHV